MKVHGLEFKVCHLPDGVKSPSYTCEELPGVVLENIKGDWWARCSGSYKAASAASASTPSGALGILIYALRFVAKEVNATIDAYDSAVNQSSGDHR